MEVRYLGFSIDITSENITIEDVFKSIEDDGKYVDEGKKGRNDRHIYANTKAHQDFILGLVVTVKDQKKFCTLVENQSGDLKIEVENLKGNEKLLDFNFFVVNKENGLGLYQHYHQSCSVKTFGYYVRKVHFTVRSSLVENEMKDKSKELQRELKEYEKTKIRAKYKSSYEFQQLLRKGSLEDILNAYKQIKVFEFEYAYLTPSVKKATPLSGFVDKKKERLVFTKGNPVQAISQAISSFVSSDDIENGKVIAQGFDGEDHTMHILNNPDVFGAEDFDNLAMKLHNLNISKFYDNKLLKELLEVCASKEYKPIFYAKVNKDA